MPHSWVAEASRRVAYFHAPFPQCVRIPGTRGQGGRHIDGVLQTEHNRVCMWTTMQHSKSQGVSQGKQPKPSESPCLTTMMVFPMLHLNKRDSRLAINSTYIKAVINMQQGRTNCVKPGVRRRMRTLCHPSCRGKATISPRPGVTIFGPPQRKSRQRWERLGEDGMFDIREK